MAIWCARLSVDRWRLSLGSEDSGPEYKGLQDKGLQDKRARAKRPGAGQENSARPTVLITETSHGSRIDAVNDAAREAGARAGMMLADARTLCPHIQTAPADPAGDLEFLEKLAVWAQRWGPWSALDPPDGLIVDVTGAAHLFGGEARLLADLEACFKRRRLSVRAAIAPTAGAAWALAHFGPASAILGPQEDVMRRLSDLPVAALRLDGDVLTVLRRLGLKRLGDLNDITMGAANRSEAAARDALHRRFRNRKSPSANPLIRLDQLRGHVPEPLLPVTARQMPVVQRRLMEPLRHRSLLDRVVEDMAGDMARELEGKGEGARRLDLGLWRVDGEVIVRRLELSAATREAAHINRLFAGKLENIDAGFGIEVVRLCSSWVEPLAATQADVEHMAELRGTSLSACIDRLSVRLGAHAVRRPAAFASHLPERAQRWQAPFNAEDTVSGILGVSGALGASGMPASEPRSRPLKLFDRPEQIAVLYASPDGHPQRFRWRGNVHEVVRVEGPERIAPEWWRATSNTRLRDYYRIEDALGRRYWMYRQGIAGDGRGGVPEWFLHGLVA